MNKNTKLQPFILRNHQHALRSALLSSSYWGRKQSVWLLFWKGGEEIMRKNRLMTAGVILSAVVVVAGSTFFLLPKNTKMAYAEEMARKSYNAVASLSPDEQKALTHKVSADAKQLLEKAKAAKDLKVLTYEEFVQQSPMPPAQSSPTGKQGPDLQRMQYLQFTDTDGSKVILGVDPNTHLPALVMVRQENPAGSEGPDSRRVNKGFGFGTSDASDKGVSFGTVDGATKLEVSIDASGAGTFLVNGKKYKLPDGTKLSTDEPPTVKLEGSDVYINGIKAIAVE